MILQTATSTDGLYEATQYLDLFLSAFLAVFLIAGAIRLWQAWFKPEL